MMTNKPQIVSTTVEIVDTGLLNPHPENPRHGTVTVIVESLIEHGQYRPLIVQRSTGHVLAGNHTLQAAIQAGMTKVAVTYLDVDDDEARRILLVDNRASDLGTYNNESLLSLLQTSDTEYGSLIGTGYDDAALADLIALLNPDDDGEMVSNSEQVYPEKDTPAFAVTLHMSVGEHEWWQSNISKAIKATGAQSATEATIALIASSLNIDLPDV